MINFQSIRYRSRGFSLIELMVVVAIFAILSTIAVNSYRRYTLQAVATGNQTKDTPACLTFTINEQGQRTPADSTGCWR